MLSIKATIIIFEKRQRERQKKRGKENHCDFPQQSTRQMHFPLSEETIQQQNV